MFLTRTGGLLTPTYNQTLLKYLEQDDEYVYFEVFELDEDKLEYESRGVIFVGKVKKLGK